MVKAGYQGVPNTPKQPPPAPHIAPITQS